MNRACTPVSPGRVARILFAALALGTGCLPVRSAVPPAEGPVWFADDFGSNVRGARVRNRISDPPPDGLGYPTDIPWGFLPARWIVADAEPDGPRRSFWCIPERTDGTIESYLCQAGRSHNSIAFAGIPVPPGVGRYVVEFRQWCNDNDYIGYVLGASRPVLEHDGVEFGYERQIPGTDQTVDAIHFRGALGRGTIPGGAKMLRWVLHRIVVDGRILRWFQDGVCLLEGELPVLRPGGYFGIRQRYERGTRYDDLRIRGLE